MYGHSRVKKQAAVESCSVSELYSCFQVSDNERKPPLIVDLRKYKEWKDGHVCRSFCVAVTSNELGRRFLEDSSTRDNNDPHDIRKKRDKLNALRGKWCPNTWMGREVFLYGGAPVSPTDEVVEFLQRDESTLPKRIRLLASSYKAFSDKYPGLCTCVNRPRAPHRYPAELVPGELYLGDWQHAEDSEALSHLNIQAVLTIHQRPSDLKIARQRTHLCITQDDTDTEAILPHITTAIDFIQARGSRAKVEGVYAAGLVSLIRDTR